MLTMFMMMMVVVGRVCLVGGAESSLPWNKGVSTRTTLGQAVASKKFVERQKA